jgi:RNA polymerase sigma-70 factor (ECF subfamily)
MVNLDEIGIIERLRRGDIAAFNELYERWHRRLYGFALYLSHDRHTSEDLVQTVFVAVWEQRRTINSSNGFGAYLFSIARNSFYDMLRHKVAEQAYITRLLSHTREHPNENDADTRVESADFDGILTTLLEKLPARRREIFLMSRQQNMSYGEIAEKLGISENTVDTQIRHALNFLRRELPKYLAIIAMAFCNF